MYISPVDQIQTEFIHHKNLRNSNYGKFHKTTSDIPSTSTSVLVLECSSNSYSTDTSKTDLSELYIVNPGRQNKNYN